MNIFISQPMNNRNAKEITDERKAIMAELRKEFNCREIDTYFQDSAPLGVKNEGTYWLGRSLVELSTADLAVFAKGWESARGCIIEHKVCEEYGIPIREV